MKESLSRINNKCIYRETNNNVSDTSKNNVSVTDVSFSNGIATYNGSSSVIETAPHTFANGITIRAKVKFDAQSLKTIVSCGDTGDLFVLGTGVQSGQGTDNDINFGMFYTSWKIASSGITPVIGQEYDIVGTMDNSNIKI